MAENDTQRDTISDISMCVLMMLLGAGLLFVFGATIFLLAIGP